MSVDDHLDLPGVVQRRRPQLRRVDDLLARTERVGDVLEHAIDVGRHLEPLRRLPGETHRVVLHVLIVETETAVGIKAVRDDVGVADVAVRAEEPQLVLDDRSAERRIEVVDVLNAVTGRESFGLQLVGEVVALKTVTGVTEEARAAQAVAAFFRNQIDEQSAARHFGARRGRSAR